MVFKQLPLSENLNIPALSRLFVDTTNSYKYLFFLSLLDILCRRHFDAQDPISFHELIIEMLANAWYPHTFFKLSFGTQDKIAKKLNSLDLVVTDKIFQFQDPDKKLLRQTIANQNLKDAIFHLRRYVPFRLIIPFLETELDGISRGTGNQIDMAIPAIAERCFEGYKPLYRFDSTQHKDCHGIIVHPDWASYLEQHYKVIRGWVAWEWLIYMQRRNPCTPAISSKLFMPVKRDSLNKQTAYWRTVLKSQQLHCIYSDRLIDTNKFSLDHYLPWSFVAHDQVWNLIPTLPEVNSSKSNNLPADQYFRKFVELQHIGLMVTHQTLSDGKWTRQIEPYINDLAIGCESDLLDVDKLQNAYEKVMMPLITLASSQGFAEDWLYSN